MNVKKKTVRVGKYIVTILLKTVVFSFRWKNGGLVIVNWNKTREAENHQDAVWVVSVTGPHQLQYTTTHKPNQTNSIMLAKKIMKT
jgi:hypothetical protein